MTNTSTFFSRLMDWFKKHTENEFLLQWIIYIILFVILIIFTTSHPELSV